MVVPRVHLLSVWQVKILGYESHWTLFSQASVVCSVVECIVCPVVIIPSEVLTGRDVPRAQRNLTV
ncbi:hypothetical protein E2C01_017052 [Portunus trituberculatus]|uniref:Uncharacterized protein n=1 Tax=Portunus trituberculatus TaxID=210409 RepID=A0A5B7DQL8_PORTR|nr:hypothetical protein [Portunus trituberculatus]